MDTNVLMDWEDNARNNFQLFRDGLNYVISSDAVDVSSWSCGCYYCVGCFDRLSEALSVFSQIVKNAEDANGIVDTTWLVETFGKQTC